VVLTGHHQASVRHLAGYSSLRTDVKKGMQLGALPWELNGNARRTHVSRLHTHGEYIFRAAVLPLASCTSFNLVYVLQVFPRTWQAVHLCIWKAVHPCIWTAVHRSIWKANTPGKYTRVSGRQYIPVSGRQAHPVSQVSELVIGMRMDTLQRCSRFLPCKSR
jgi:hypothetical protein